MGREVGSGERNLKQGTDSLGLSTSRDSTSPGPPDGTGRPQDIGLGKEQPRHEGLGQSPCPGRRDAQVQCESGKASAHWGRTPVILRQTTDPEELQHPIYTVQLFFF